MELICGVISKFFIVFSALFDYHSVMSFLLSKLRLSVKESALEEGEWRERLEGFSLDIHFEYRRVFLFFKAPRHVASLVEVANIQYRF